MTAVTAKNKSFATHFLLSIFALSLAVLLGIWLGVSRSTPTDEKLQSENDQLQRYVRQLQQQLTVVNAKSADLETLQKVQDQVIDELRTGNRELQDEMHKIEKDMQVYKERIKRNN